ncbi:MAG: protein kinase [Candidatus Latescibacteria bacterium]|nr:protein kinase [Candidatus Latescibacterota bacterium]NIO57366.1 protein kinase [Candidatus Latescibacterota bacterium]
MIGRTIAHYKILEELGEEEMGILYKAEDTKLKRIVALQFLRTDAFIDKTQIDHILREVQAAASLDHPNISAIYEIVEEEDQICVAMVYAPGITLQEKIRSGPLAIEEAARIAIEIATGLEAAHDKGIIHRDIKCSNIMVLDDGHVKIMRFGLAAVSNSIENHDLITAGGAAAYMSPEQCRGESPDHRSDIWSLGVCLYEMVTGELPFKGVYAQAVMYSILNEDPAALSDLHPNVPVELAEIVSKAMEKEPDQRYQRIRDLLVDLEILRRGIISRTIVVQPSRVKKQPSIAVLPFVDMSPCEDQGYFCDGMAEEITNALNQIEGLRVAARTSAFAFKGGAENIREMGKKLGVKTLLEGSVSKEGKQLQITVKLTNVDDGYQLWSERYHRELEDVFAIQDEIAENVVQALKVELSEKDERVLAKVSTKDYQAYDFYLRGRQFYRQTHRRGINFALEMYEHAIERDPTYALAYAGMADCYSYLFSFFDSNRANLEKAMSLSQKALDLDLELAEGHVARGLAFYRGAQYDEAEREFETAIRLNPNLFAAYESYARTCYSRGHLEKAARLFDQACRKDPENFDAPLLLSQTYRGLNLDEQAKESLERGLANVKKHLDLNPDDARALYMSAIGLAVAGEKEQAFKWIERALSIDPEDPMILYGAACVFALTGWGEEAITQLERALSAGCCHKDWVERDSDFDSLRSHPRFKALLEKLE